MKLPSRALFYKEGVEISETAKQSGEVYITPMTTIDEIAFTSADKLLNGTAVTEVFGHCIPDIKSPLDMLAADVDFLTIALRQVSYGSHFDVTWTHDCEQSKGETQKYEATVAELLSNTKYIDDSALASYKKELSNGQVVQLRPITYRQQLESQRLLDKAYQMRKRYYEVESDEEREALGEDIAKISNDEYITVVSAVVYSVDGVTDRANIQDWVRQLPIYLRQELVDKATELTKNSWGAGTTVKCTCKHCGKEKEVEVDLNPISFFTQPSGQAITS